VVNWRNASFLSTSFLGCPGCALFVVVIMALLLVRWAVVLKDKRSIRTLLPYGFLRSASFGLVSRLVRDLAS
jgi:hypothetical protein